MNRVLFFSGAGLSADSGLSTFRDAGGLWEKYDINKVCNIHTWIANYDLVHEFYNMRRIEYKKALPNKMHEVIARLQQEFGQERVIVITQNVDTLLERAGCTEVLHVHGRIDKIHCYECKREWDIEDEFEGMVCPCGSTTFKPSIIFFGEAAPAYQKMYQLIGSLKRNDTIVVIGTDGSVVPINWILGPKDSGIKAYRILCNLHRSQYIDDENFDEVFYERAIDAAEKIEAICRKRLIG